MEHMALQIEGECWLVLQGEIGLAREAVLSGWEDVGEKEEVSVESLRAACGVYVSEVCARCLGGEGTMGEAVRGLVGWMEEACAGKRGDMVEGGEGKGWLRERKEGAIKVVGSLLAALREQRVKDVECRRLNGYAEEVRGRVEEVVRLLEAEGAG